MFMRDGTNRWTRRCAGLLAAAVLATCLLPALAPAQVAPATWRAVRAQPAVTMDYTVTFTEEDLAFGTLEGYDTVRLAEAGYLNDPGRPLVPAQTLRIAVPGDMAVTGVRVAATQAVELPGEYWLYPGQPPRRISDRGPAVFVEPDAQTYGSDQAYPGELVRLGHQADLAGQAMAVIEVYPLQYVPAEKKLVLHTSIDLVLEGEPGYVCGDYLPVGLSPERQAVWEQRVAELVANPEDVVLQAGEVAVGGRGVPPGTYDYVIITQNSWVSNFQPLADWKTKKGVRANIVTTDWIYNQGGYGGSNVDKIRAFVQDARNTWGTMYFLLGGDTNVIPYHSRYLLGEYVPNDTYYADYDNDWVCEVHVGRASVTSTGHIATFINKVLTYEKNPPLTNYAKTAFFMGFDLYTYNSGEGQGLMQYIKNNYLPGSWTYNKVYDSDSGNHHDYSLMYLNQGHNLVNHADHSYTEEMGTGSTNHGWHLHSSEMSALYNGAKQSILYTLGCYAGNYVETCIGEAFVRNSNGGGAVFMGNSRYGWYMPYDPSQYSFEYSRNFFRSLFQQGQYRVGQCFSHHKNNSSIGDNYYKYIFTELTLLGDPELLIWTENPQNLTVSHQGTLNVGEYTSFPVQVTSGGNPVGSATACLWKSGDVYEIAQTNASGQATFWFAPGSEGTLHVTVTRHNYLPYEGQAQVTSGGATTVLPADLTVFRGSIVSGDLNDLFASDDSWLIVAAGMVLFQTEPPVWLILEGTAPSASPSQLQYRLEAHAVTTGVFTQKIELYNYVTQSYELVDTRPATMTDSVVEVTLSGDLSRFIQPGTLQMKAQLTWRATGPVGGFPWQIATDEAVWIVTP